MENDFSKNKKEEYLKETISSNQAHYDPSIGVNLKIKQEKLDISKEWVQTGDAKVFRETFLIQKTFTVPVERVEIVVMKKALALDEFVEVTRIPISEEYVEFTKHKVDLEDVSIYKQKIEDIQSIETRLKREELKVTISGSLKVKD